MDVACGGGIESVIGAYSRGAPLRIVGSEMIGSPDTYWVSTVQFTDQVARGRLWQDNQLFAEWPLLEQYHVDAKQVATGGHPGTLTMVMTGQIDIGRGATPFGLELVDRGDSVLSLAAARSRRGQTRPCASASRICRLRRNEPSGADQVCGLLFSNPVTGHQAAGRDTRPSIRRSRATDRCKAGSALSRSDLRDLPTYAKSFGSGQWDIANALS
jgi:hypothetical protein